jgi:hypothetical protein
MREKNHSPRAVVQRAHPHEAECEWHVALSFCASVALLQSPDAPCRGAATVSGLGKLTWGMPTHPTSIAPINPDADAFMLNPPIAPASDSITSEMWRHSVWGGLGAATDKQADARA